MKKTFWFVLMSVSAVCVIFGQSGVLREMTGEVELKPAGKAAFSAAKTGDEIARDTIVSTGFKSTAVIAIGSSTITVRPLTRLSLAEIHSASDTENINVNLQAGRVKVDVKPPAGTKANMTIQSPGATASVRGTSFEFDTVNLTVLEGTVAFGSSSSGVATMVQGGKSSFVGTDGQPVSPVEVSNANLLPPMPVGADLISTPVQPPNLSTGDIAVTIEYN